MPLTVKSECCQCDGKESVMWRNTDKGVICSDCFEKSKEKEKLERVKRLKEKEAEAKAEQADLPRPLKIPLRKSTRMTRNYKTRGNPYALPKPNIGVGRGRGRRGVQRRAPMKAPSEGRFWLMTNRAYVLDGYLRIGDIVSLYGTDDLVYYAQLRGFMCDLYGEKVGVITWLLPNEEREPGPFIPEHFYLGPDEDTPRRLDTMEFVYRMPANCSLFCKPPPSAIENFVREPLQVA